MDCPAKHFESCFRFIPVLDEVFAKPGAKPRTKRFTQDPIRRRMIG